MNLNKILIIDNMKNKLQIFLFWLFLLTLLLFICKYFLIISYPGSMNATVIVGKQCIHLILVLIPLISVLIAEKWNVKSIISNYQISFKNVAIKAFVLFVLSAVLLFPLLILFFTYIGGNLLHIESLGKVFSIESPYFFSGIKEVVSKSFIGFILAIIPAFLGEIAWRGFLEKNIAYSRTIKTFLIGLIWGLWSIFLIVLNYVENQESFVYPIILKILLCIACSFYFVNALKLSRTIFTSSIMQAFIAFMSVRFLMAGNPNYLIADTHGVLAIVTIIIINGLLSRFLKSS